MSRHSGPSTRSQAVSDSYPPTHILVCWVQSLVAALAGGSPLSSPSPSSGGRSQSPSTETVLIPSPLQQAAPSQGTTSSAPPDAMAQSASLPAGAFLADLGTGAPPTPVGDEDVVMKLATLRDIAKALKDIVACLPAPLGGVEWVVNEAKAKLGAATSDVGIVTVFPHQFQSDIHEYLRGYRMEVKVLASAHSSLSKLRKHCHAKLYPVALNSIKVPSIQFSHAFLNTPATEGHRSSYNTMSGTGQVLFEPAVELAVKAMKDKVLKNWTSEKDKEVTFLERKASVASALASLEEVVHVKHWQLKARYDYLDGTSAHNTVVGDVDALAAISLALTMTIITKVNSLVLDEEDKRLEIAIKKMMLVKPAAAAGSQAATNDVLELKKMVGDLAKKIEMQGCKVCDQLYPLLCYCAGHLSLTMPLLETLLTGLVKAGWEEVSQKEEGKERQGHQDRYEKGQKSPSCRRFVQGKRQRQGRQTHCKVKAAGQQEEGWQEVSATFGLRFGMDSALASPVSVFRLFAFLTCMVWIGLYLLAHVISSVCPSLPPHYWTLACAPLSNYVV